MKINPNLEAQGGQAATGAGATGASNATQPNRQIQANPSSGSDKADLSSEAQLFTKLSAQMANVPSTRSDRVASLSKAIQDGTYNVSNQQIAQAMTRDLAVG